MGLLKAANSTALQWTDVEKAPYSSDYVPVMALAQNHIFFLNVPGVSAGSASIYVIHCKTRLRPVTTPLMLSIHISVNYFQPNAQAFPASNGAIPATHGRTASFFQNAGVCRHPCCIHYIYLIVLSPPQVQEAFAFIPDDGSATYVLNVETNTTETLAGPTTKDARATYFAGNTSLVQLDSTGAVSYLPYSLSDSSANAAAKWSKVVSLANAAPPTNGSSGTSTSKSLSPSGTSKAQSSSKGSNGAVTVVAPANLLGGLVSVAMLACAAVLF